MKSSAASLGLAFLGILLVAIKIASLQGTFIFCVGFLIFSLPGIALGPALFGCKWLSEPEMYIFCPPLGIALSGSVAVLTGYLVRWSPGVILLAVAILTMMCALASHIFPSRLLFHSPRRWEQWEYVLLAAIFLMLGIFVTVPFLSLGQETSHGYAYTWLFGYDFLVRGEYTRAMTMGFPPTCLPLAGEPLHMYLVGYALPAFVTCAAKNTLTLHRTLLLTSLSFDLFLCAGLFAFLRKFAEKSRHLIPLAALLVCGYSYYWWIPTAKFLASHTHLPPALGTTLEQFGNVSHLFTPLLLVEPQAVLGTCLLLFLLFDFQSTGYEIENPAVAVLYGITLGAAFGTDALWGLTLMLWVGIVGLWKLLTDKSQVWRRFTLLTIVVVASALTSGCFFLAGMYQLKSGQEMSLSIHSWFFKFAPVYLLVEFGPLFLMGIWGFVEEWRAERAKISWGVLFLGLLGLLQTAFLQVSVLPRTRMATRVFPIVFLVGAAYFLRRSDGNAKSPARLVLAWVLILLAAPTFFTDIHFASNIGDVNETRYVSKPDRQACNWINRTLPESAVIQGEAQYRGYAQGYNPRQELYISLIADFAERKQALGWNYVASELVPNGSEVVAKRAKELESMLSASETGTVRRIASQYGISYIYVGPYEKALHPKLFATLSGSPDLFTAVYNIDGVTIFHILN